ncbi:MAG: hypothetical protein ACLVHL_00120 [Collinsella intestinalis]|nr:hypothetical protein [Collinsella intestinalis]
MIQFIKEHWVQYLIGATVAVLLGLGLSFFLGGMWSTPESIRAERVEAEQQKGEELDEIDFETRAASRG